MLSDNRLYAAFKAKDPRFDGVFFVGISSTGIYCRPVCRAKQPKVENCTFYSTAAKAEQAGYRPCLLCRPEIASGASVHEASSSLAARAARMLEQNCGSGQRLGELAALLGCTDRHLRRVFTEEYGVSPVEYLQTCRLLLAKNLLTDTSLSVLDIAMAAGFGSLRRFNDLFKKRYRLSPTQLKKNLPEQTKQTGDITVTLGYRPPYRFEDMLRFLAGRAIPGVEIVTGSEYRRTVCLVNADGHKLAGWLLVTHNPQKNALNVTVSEQLLPVLSQVLAKVRRMFDLYCDPQTVYEALAPMNDIRPGLCVPGTRIPGCFDAFEMSVRAVLGQQITVRAATTLAGRIADTYGTPLQTGIPGLTCLFPSAEDFLVMECPIESQLGPLGVIRTRARTIHALAAAFGQNSMNFDSCTQPDQEIEKLMSITGIGSWTAQYIAMRAMAWPDAFLETDAAIKKALAPHTPREMLVLAEAWRPWRSYATINLWNSLL